MIIMKIMIIIMMLMIVLMLNDEHTNNNNGGYGFVDFEISNSIISTVLRRPLGVPQLRSPL